MINYLYSNRYNALLLNDKAAINAAGGVGLVTLPPLTHYAYNPAKMTYSRWYYLTGAYAPTNKPVPIRVYAEGGKVKLSAAATTTLYVGVEYYIIVGDTILADNTMLTIPAGSTEVTYIDGTVYRVFGLSLYNSDIFVTAVKDSTEQLYYAQGANYTDSDYIISGGEVMYRADEEVSSMTVQLTQFKGGGNYQFTMVLHNGECSLDVSSIIKNWFLPQLSEMESYQRIDYTGSLEHLCLDNRLYIRYILTLPFTLDDTNSDRIECMAVNGAAQIGEESTITTQGLLNRLSVYKYAGYPAEETWLSLSSAQTRGSATFPYPSIGRIEVSNYVSARCTPPSPFFVRWIGANGAVEQYMFSHRQTFKPAVKSASVAEVDIDKTEEARTNIIPYDLSTENKVIIGAEDIPDDEFAILSGLPFSPEVEWYDTKKQKWIRLVVEKYDTGYNSDTNTHSLEITLSLPTFYTQF